MRHALVGILVAVFTVQAFFDSKFNSKVLNLKCQCTSTSHRHMLPDDAHAWQLRLYLQLWVFRVCSQG